MIFYVYFKIITIVIYGYLFLEVKKHFDLNFFY